MLRSSAIIIVTRWAGWRRDSSGVYFLVLYHDFKRNNQIFSSSRPSTPKAQLELERSSNDSNNTQKREERLDLAECITMVQQKIINFQPGNQKGRISINAERRPVHSLKRRRVRQIIL
jgi:hypothetical protein